MTHVKFEPEVTLNNAIEDMLEVTDSKHSKVTTMVNSKDAWDSKEHVNNPPLLYAILNRTADLIAEKDYKSWYNKAIKTTPWIPLQHLDQLQHPMLALAKLATTPSLIRTVLDGKDLDPKPFIRIQNAAAELI
eukprot:15309719-Ditylum_brightwellii.AAC.1